MRRYAYYERNNVEDAFWQIEVRKASWKRAGIWLARIALAAVAAVLLLRLL